MNIKDEALRAALEFVEFCWQDVSLNEWAEEQRAETEKLLRRALSESNSCVSCKFNKDNKCTWLIQKHNRFAAPSWVPPQMYVGEHLMFKDCPAWEPL